MVSEDQHHVTSLPSPLSPSVKVPCAEEYAHVRMKLLCSHGGKILPRPDGQLRYVGGDTRLVTFSKNIGFQDLTNKLEKLFGSNLCMKYQLPSEDLDVLISVTCDEDVENLIEEYEKNEAREGASRLRAFLFPSSGLVSLSSSHVHCQTMEDIRSPPQDHKISPRAQGVAFSHSPLTFSMPEVNNDNGFDGHVSRHQYKHNEVEDQHSPRSPRQVVGSPLKAVGPNPFHGIPANYSRPLVSSSSPIDYGGRGPALTTSALGSLSSNQHQKQLPQHFEIWEEGNPLVSHRNDKRRGELDSESHHQIFLHDSGIAVPMVRIPSKDFVVPDNSAANIQAMMARRPKPQTMPHVDMHPDFPEAFLDARQDVLIQGNNMRHYISPEMQRAHHTHTNSEVQWGIAQQSVSDKCIDGQRNDGDSERGHRKLEMHSTPENIMHTHHFVRHEDITAQQQSRHGEYEISSPLQSRHDHLHHMGKSHFQPVYWQIRDGSQEHQQYQGSNPETNRIGHGMQKHGQSFEAHMPLSASSGVYTHYQHPPNMFARPDALSSSRLSSPSYRQATSDGPTSPRQHHDSTSPRRLPDSSSPRVGQMPNVGSHLLSSPHGIWALQQESKAQQISGQMFSDPVEGHQHYTQSGKQLHVVERGIAMNPSGAMVNQGQYLNKIVPTNLDGLNTK